MSVSESRRHDLYNGLNEVLGSELADTLMSYLRTATDLVTRDDLRDTETRLGDRIDRLEGSMDEFNRRMDRFFLALVTGMMGVVATLIAATFFG